MNQVTVPATDIAASIAFYQALGLRLIVRSEHYARFECPDVAGGDADPEQLAQLTDRLCVNARQRQVYGTQMHMVEGQIVPWPIEQLEHVDERRASVGLPPLADYLEAVRRSYGAR